MAGMSRRMRWIPAESSRVSAMVKRFQNSCWNWRIMLLVVTTRMRRALPRRISSAVRMPASSVLPRPTVSAMSRRGRRLCSARQVGSSWKGMVSITPCWPITSASPCTADWRSRASMASRPSMKPGELSNTSLVPAGSRTVTSSSTLRNSAWRLRTVSDTPTQASCQPPCSLASARWTSHSSSRMRTRAPGAGAWVSWVGMGGGSLRMNGRLSGLPGGGASGGTGDVASGVHRAC